MFKANSLFKASSACCFLFRLHPLHSESAPDDHGCDSYCGLQSSMESSLALFDDSSSSMKSDASPLDFSYLINEDRRPFGGLETQYPSPDHQPQSPGSQNKLTEQVISCDWLKNFNVEDLFLTTEDLLSFSDLEYYETQSPAPETTVADSPPLLGSFVSCIDKAPLEEANCPADSNGQNAADLLLHREAPVLYSMLTKVETQSPAPEIATRPVTIVASNQPKKVRRRLQKRSLLDGMIYPVTGNGTTFCVQLPTSTAANNRTNAKTKSVASNELLQFPQQAKVPNYKVQGADLKTSKTAVDCRSMLSALASLAAANNRSQEKAKPYNRKTTIRDFLEQRNMVSAPTRGQSRHARTHTGEKSYTCLVCGNGFAKSGSLTRHARIHTGEKPHTCIVCDKAFARLDSLAVHTRSHMEKKHECKMCNKAFTESSGLTRHKKTHMKRKKKL